MVVVDGFDEGLTEDEEIADVEGKFDVGRLEVDGVEVADEDVMGKGHFRCY